MVFKRVEYLPRHGFPDLIMESKMAPVYNYSFQIPIDSYDLISFFCI